MQGRNKADNTQACSVEALRNTIMAMTENDHLRQTTTCNKSELPIAKNCNSTRFRMGTCWCINVDLQNTAFPRVISATSAETLCFDIPKARASDGGIKGHQGASGTHFQRLPGHQGQGLKIANVAKPTFWRASERVQIMVLKF